MSSAGEGGLLGLAFHPDYAANGKVYLHLTNEAGDNEVFDTSTGRLYYDADGSSSGASQLIATVQSGAAVAATDITVI